jgi:polyhydroxybutyrate depolymerase
VLSYQGGLLPMVVLLHGYGANAGFQDFFFALSPDVEELGFVLLLPEGTEDADGRQFWNATEACCDFGLTGVDDVGYLSALVDEAVDALPVDPARVVVLGHSNGGFMAYRLACEDPVRFPAIASLAGAMPWDPADCEPGAPVAVLQMHGDADVDVLYDGWAGFYPSAEEAVERFAAFAGCEDRPSVDSEADHDSVAPGEETEKIVRSGCERDVQLWRMRGSGHLPIPTARYHADLRDWLFAER